MANKNRQQTDLLAGDPACLRRQAKARSRSPWLLRASVDRRKIIPELGVCSRDASDQK
ncbi:MAG: hypothetical protein Q7K26_04600 [bacterium]|nr:hypothetical protein [bacterium]